MTLGLVVLCAVACNLDLKPFVDGAPDAGGFSTTPTRDAEAEPDAFVIDPNLRDAAPDAADAGKKKRVFVTSTATSGGFGGLAAGDARCQQLATAAKLDGVFVAWLSADTASAISRLKDVGPWFLVDGTSRVFTSKATIPLGPDSVIDRDEKNDKVEAADVWTGTNAAGAATGANCNNWAIAIGAGTKGKTNKRDTDWTAAGTDNCNGNERLYCFEQ